MAIVEQRMTPRPGIFTGRRWRRLKEALTAYVFLLPAFLIIGIFGLFPIGFAAYVSLHRWRIIPGEYRGLANYVKALDTLAYVAAFWCKRGAQPASTETSRGYGCCQPW